MKRMSRAAAAKKEAAKGTASRLLAIPEAESLAGKKEIRALDFGYGDGIMTIGIAEAIVRLLGPERLNLLAVNSERSNGGSEIMEFMLGESFVELTYAEPYTAYFPHDLSKVMLMCGVAAFDVISLFNPSPPESLMRPIMESNRVLMANEFGIDVRAALAMAGYLGRSRSEAEYLSEITGLLDRNYGFVVEGGPDLVELKRLAKRVALQRTIEIFPLVLSQEGILIVACDDLVPHSEVGQILGRAGFDIVMSGPNEPADVWSPSGLANYNKHLFAAVKKQGKKIE